ncbi:MAG: DUF4901 domain-containing protein [Oscillospiraceae bacterium]|nr:DUF4901 domain-containing protein [Oscillospiraceae bacterium]
MKFRRLISAALGVLLAVSAVPYVPATAQDNGTSSKTEENAETTAMRNAILDIKKRVTIPKSLDKFEYETKTQYDTTYYQFRWYRMNENDDYDDYYDAEEAVSVEYYNGFISIYRHSVGRNGSSKPSFAKLSAKEQDDLAKKYLYQLNPDLKGNPVIERTSSEMNLFRNTVDYSISRKESGIDFGSNYGSITIDRDTGELLEYSLKWWSDAKLPDASKKLSVKEVSDIYASRKPLKAYYDLFTKYEYNAETDEHIYTPYVLAVYEPTVSGENEIDALTGKYTSLYDDREKFSYTDAYSWSRYDSDDVAYAPYDEEAYDDDDYDLSDAEKEALEKENEYLSYEEALKIIKADEYIVFNKELVLKSNTVSSYTDDYGVSRPSRYLKFEFTSSDETKDNIYLNVTLDAYSGNIISFSKSYDYGDKSKNKNTTVLNEKTALATAGKAAKHFIGGKAGEYRYDNNMEIDENTVEGSFYYTRYVNGLPAVFDTMTVWVDSRGEVLGFGHIYHEIEFPEANLVTEEEAYKKLFERMKPDLYYTGFTDLQLASHVYLTYEFEPNYLINAVTGERITSRGEPYYIAEKKSEPQKEAKLYTDIKGHKYEKEITTLFEYGIRITDSETLDPDGAITIEEFAKLCRQAHGTNILGLYPSERKYNKETDRYEYFENHMLKKKLTRGELAKIYVYTYANNCFTAAGIEGIYAPPYKNVSQDNPYCGYIAIAKAKGLISDGEEFGYNTTLSRGKCLKAFYDYIANDKEKELYEIAAI